MASNNEVRIISGLWKGRKLRFQGGSDLRPSLGRVRETLFNWLVADLPDARCLDLFAGSGALGFEALSRGASAVTFVDRNRRSVDALRSNARLLKTDAATVICSNAEHFLKSPPEDPWDIIFFDPPFADRAAYNLLAQLRSSRFLKPQGLIYIEGSRREPLPFAAELLKQSQAGDCHFALLGSPERH